MFYDAFIRSRMTYACQTWTLTKEQIRRLDAADAYLKRRMIRNGFKRLGTDDPENSYPQAYFYSNSDVYKFVKNRKGRPSPPLSEYINHQRTKFAAHICRQPNKRHTKQLLFNSNKYHRTGNTQGNLLKQVAQIRGVHESQFIQEARRRDF